MSTTTTAGDADRPVILLSVPPAELSTFFPAPTLQRLGEIASHLRVIAPAELQEPDAFSAAMHDVDIAVVAWGFPRLDAERLRLAPRLRILMNAASSVKHLVSDELWDRGIVVSQAGEAMAPAVAEMSLTLTLSLLRRVGRMDHALRTGAEWAEARRVPRAQEISACRIGVVGASRTGRRYIDMVKALGGRVRLADPYVSSDDPLHDLVVPLDELIADCDVLALHAPSTAETKGLISAGHIASLPRGTAVVNTARQDLIDDDALFAAAAAGHIDVALDVHSAEPLPTHDRWRTLPNVILSAHIGGATEQSRGRAGQIVLDEVGRSLDGQPLHHRIDRSDLYRMG